MKRLDLMRRLSEFASDNGLEMEVVEGAKHTKVVIGEARTVVPRHREINEITAGKILRQMGADA